MDTSVIANTESLVSTQFGTAKDSSDSSDNSVTGINKIQEMFFNSQSENSETTTVNEVKNLDSPMELLKSSVSGYLGREQELETGLDSMKLLSAPPSESVAEYHTQSQLMLSMQMAYNEKSLNGAMLLSTGKSAEGFVKTLMRSQ